LRIKFIFILLSNFPALTTINTSDVGKLKKLPLDYIYILNKLTLTMKIQLINFKEEVVDFTIVDEDDFAKV
jgi:hypothetical protein